MAIEAPAALAHLRLAAQRRTVVQYDFRDDETWAYCNDGTLWVLDKERDRYAQVAYATIPQPE